MHMLDPIHLLLDGVPQHRIVDHLKDKQRLRNLSERLQRPTEGVLPRVRVEPAEQVRSSHLLELDSRDHAQDLIPLLNHNLVIGVASGLDLPGGAVYPLAVPEDMEPLAREVFEAGSVGEAQQMADGSTPLSAPNSAGGVLL
jgi:hypothetical protein